MYPDEVDICNCGADFGTEPPQVNILAREGLEEGSIQWQMQMYGAALYWHLGTTPGETGGADANMLTGKDVLEVACGRGGGARYLTEVVLPRSYLATDVDEDELERCRQQQQHGATLPDGLAFEVVGAGDLAERFPACSFDAVLCVQSIAVFKDPESFIKGAAHVLRPGGRLLLCDLLSVSALQAIVSSVEETGLICNAVNDLSESVNKVGICAMGDQRGYAHIVATKTA